MSSVATDRSTRLGGSDAAAVLGISPFKTPLELYEEKLGLRPPQPTTWAMKRGIALESQVADEYVLMTGRGIRVAQQHLVHPVHSFLTGSIDREVVCAGPRRILEVKTTTRRDGWGEEESDEIPEHYLAQVHVYLALSGAHVCDVAVDLGTEVRLYQVPHDEALENHIVEKMAAFWTKHVLARVPPEPSTSAEASRAWRAVTGKAIVASEALLLDVADLRALKDQQKALDDRREVVELRIKSEMTDSDCAIDFNGLPVVTWKAQTSNQLDVTRLKEDAPALYQQFSVQSETRVLRTPSPKRK